MEGLGGLVAELPLPVVLVRESRPTLWEGLVVAGLLEGCQKGENKMKYSPCVNVFLFIFTTTKREWVCGSNCEDECLLPSEQHTKLNIITKE